MKKTAAVSLCIALGAMLAATAWSMGRAASTGGRPALQKALTVSAAANLQYVLPKIADAYAASTGRKVNLSFGATGSIAQQIKAGAPIDLFLSADVKTVKGLVDAGHADAGTVRVYAVGRLVLRVSDRAAFIPAAVREIADPRIARIGIANPEIAPYGNAAREACRKLGIWETIQDRLIVGENVGQVMTYAARGEVDVAFVPLSYEREKKGTCLDVPDGLYAPIEQALAVPKSAPDPEGGKAFARYLTTDRKALDLLAGAGYALPAKR